MNNIISKIFGYAGNMDCEVILFNESNSLTRIGDNEISQNIHSEQLYAKVRLQKESKNFTFALNRFDDNTLKIAFENALNSLKYLKKEKDFQPLLKTSVHIDSKRIYNEETANLSPLFKSKIAKKLSSSCKKKGLISYGIISNGKKEIIISNNKNVYQRHIESFIEYDITVKCGLGYGAANAYSFKNDLDFDEINEKAIKKAELAKNPIDIKPGKYTVILEPQAANELLFFIADYGFSGQNYVEKTSFVSENLGKKLFPSAITIIDNSIDGKAASMPFDFEGYPKEKIELISNGIVKNIVTDRKIAKKTGFRYTGHSLPQPNTSGSIPLNVEMKEGDKSLNEMIEESDNAILITQLHYTNCLKPKTIEMTGMTRNGTFLIKNGKISKAVKNLRFNQSAIEAFKNIISIGDKAEVFSMYIWKSACPGLKIKDFNFSSGTKF
jgi:predicted Zn-dependent protease